MKIFRIFTLLFLAVLILNANIIDRTLLSLGGGQISVGREDYGSGGMGLSLASHLQNNFYLGAELDTAVFNGSNRSVDMHSGLDMLVNLSPLLGYRIGENFYVYAKAGYTAGTLAAGAQAISGMRWGGTAQYDLNEKWTLSANYMSGKVSVDYVGGTRDETLTSMILNLGMRF